jgi:hypothetical protein
MAGSNDTVIVEILNGVAGFDGLGGPVIGTSNPVLVNTPGFHQTIHFDFPLGVMLEPGQTYVALLSAPGGILGVSHTADLYAGGQFLHQGVALNSFPRDRDMIFSEGSTSAIPEPTTVWLIALGFAAVVVYRKVGAKIWA